MSDMYGDRGRRRRRRGMRREYEEEPHISSTPPTAATRPPIILTKPDRVTGAAFQPTSDDHSTSNATDDATESGVTVMKTRTRDDSSHHSTSAQSIPSMLAGDSLPTQLYQRRTPTTTSTSSTGVDKLTVGSQMTSCVKLVDDSLGWCESANEMLLDQTDFLVVGVIGQQAVGKSTILSHLATSPLENTRSPVFPVQTTDIIDQCSHQTQGIDMFISTERTIFLDTQPILSTSVLDMLIHSDYKYPVEYTCTENCVEIQSLQMASFLMAVCHVIIVVVDGFPDLASLRFLQTAEMLKPSTPPPPHDPGNDPNTEFYPHTVFAVNQASRENLTAEGYKNIETTIQRVMKQSKLKITGRCNMRSGRLIPGLTLRPSTDDVNLFLIPEHTKKPPNTNGVLSYLPGYRGHIGFDVILHSMNEQILSSTRTLLTHTTLSEKNWFHYAARTWEGVKKSSLFSEYNRLLP